MSTNMPTALKRKACREKCRGLKREEGKVQPPSLPDGWWRRPPDGLAPPLSEPERGASFLRRKHGKGEKSPPARPPPHCSFPPRTCETSPSVPSLGV
jgi:hypothetical protein